MILVHGKAYSIPVSFLYKQGINTLGIPPKDDRRLLVYANSYYMTAGAGLNPASATVEISRRLCTLLFFYIFNNE